MKESQDFREFIELLNKHEVRYLIVGGYALSYHSRPRFTQDIDFWIDKNKENAKAEPSEIFKKYCPRILTDLKSWMISSRTLLLEARAGVGIINGFHGLIFIDFKDIYLKSPRNTQCLCLAFFKSWMI